MSVGPLLRASVLVVLQLWISLAAFSQECRVAPPTVQLGQTIRLHCSSEASTARWNGRTVRLFKQAEGDLLGLMPVAVTDSPGSYAVEFLADNGSVIQSVPVTVRATRFPSQNVALDPAIASLHSSPEEIQTLTTFRDSVSDVRYWEDPFAAPISGCVTSPFGVKRLHNGKPTGEFHGGVDQRSSAGSPIRAVAAGVVVLAQPFTVLGGTVGVDHGQGLETMYLHMSKLEAQPGARVGQGDILGYVGSTGRSNGPHLHWVIYVNGVPVNPSQWVKLKPCGGPKSRARRPQR
jgi:murein DD-endopeptidase MepM/ murein hydrolase activator NlpD